MTDNDKLTLITRLEDEEWTTLMVRQDMEAMDLCQTSLEIIERCQRIRAGLVEPVFTVPNTGIYQRSSSGDEGF